MTPQQIHRKQKREKKANRSAIVRSHTRAVGTPQHNPKFVLGRRSLFNAHDLVKDTHKLSGLKRMKEDIKRAQV